MDNPSIFSSQDRNRIREKLVAAARADARLGGAAHLGSFAIGSEDRWSDIDLALSLLPESDMDQVLADWTTRLYEDHAAVAHYDVRHGSILYRVFLLDSTLQVDFSFWPSGELRAIGPKFHLIFGAAGEPTPPAIPRLDDLIGMAWLYALHVRSSIARSRLLQAEYMLSGMRDNLLALMCVRHGVPSAQGRGLDDLPVEERACAIECLARSIEPSELRRAFQIASEALLNEMKFVDAAQAHRLEPTLRLMVTCLPYE